MRPAMILASATIALVLGVTLPAQAWNDGRGYGTVYVHHHIYAPLRYKHVYHIHGLGPYHVNVIDLSGVSYAPGAYGSARRVYWHWAGDRGDW
jgi:hypothetical protein